MDLNKNYIKKKIYLEEKLPTAYPSTGIFGGVVGTPKSIKDFYINIFLTKTCEIFEYVDTQRDDKIFVVDRQRINPFYINFGFFNTVQRIKVNNSSDLTLMMKHFLNINYTDSISNFPYNGDVSYWFDDIGYNQLLNDVTIMIDSVTGEKREENGIEKLEKLREEKTSIVSKSYFFPIFINK